MNWLDGEGTMEFPKVQMEEIFGEKKGKTFKANQVNLEKTYLNKKCFQFLQNQMAGQREREKEREKGWRKNKKEA